MNVSEQALWTLDAIAALPFLWVLVYLVAGLFSGNGARFTVPAVWCLVGLVSTTYVALRVAEVIS